MQIHVFVATTKGLVAIQHIYPFDDKDIHSVVSIRGTSTIAGISDAYHRFVKKGVGIIEAHFGGANYRLNIARAIDSGNSWQLGVYLAHLAYQHHVLGDGSPGVGDIVFCCTGEVNTSTGDILAVADINTKLRLAQSDIEQWNTIGIASHFIIPNENASIGLINNTINIHSISNIIALREYLHNCCNTIFDNITDASSSTCSPIDNDVSDTSITVLSHVAPELIVEENIGSKKHNKIFPLFVKKWSYRFSLLVTVVSILLIALTVMVTVPSNNTIVKPSTGVLGLSAEDIRVGMSFASASNCDYQRTSKNLKVSNEQYFIIEPASLDSLCSLYFSFPNKIKSLILVSETKAIIPLFKRNERWYLPLPSNKTQNRTYSLLIAETTFTPRQHAQLEQFLSSLAPGTLVQPHHLRLWLSQYSYQAELASQTLIRHN